MIEQKSVILHMIELKKGPAAVGCTKTGLDVSLNYLKYVGK